MKDVLALMPAATYSVKSFAVDADRTNVSAYAVFSGTRTGEGGPVPATGKRLSTDYVYVMQFDDHGRISHMQKIWKMRPGDASAAASPSPEGR